MVQSTKGYFRAFRHVLTPSVGLSYRPENRQGLTTSKKPVYNDPEVKDSIVGIEETEYSIYKDGIYGAPNGKESGKVNFGFLNNFEMKVKTKSDGETKFSYPRRRDQMICAIRCRQVVEHLESINLRQHILPYYEPDLYNDYITKEPDYMDRFYINFPCSCVLGHVLSDSDLLDNLGPWKEIV